MLVQEVPSVELLKLTFAVDVLCCPKCEGKMRIIAFISCAKVVHKILEHLGLPTELPQVAAARRPAQHELGWDEDAWDEDAVHNPEDASAAPDTGALWGRAPP